MPVVRPVVVTSPTPAQPVRRAATSVPRTSPYRGGRPPDGSRSRRREGRTGKAVHRLPQADAHRLLAAQLGHLGRGGRVAARPVQRHRERQGRGRSPGVLLLGRPDHQGQGRQVPHVHEHLVGDDGIQPGLVRLRRLPRRQRAKGAGALPCGKSSCTPTTARTKGTTCPRSSCRTAATRSWSARPSPFTIYKSSSLDGPWTGCVASIQTNGIKTVSTVACPPGGACNDTHYDSNVSLVARHDGKFEIVQRHGSIAIADTLCGPYRMQKPTWTYPQANLPNVDSIYPKRTSIPGVSNPTYGWEEDPHIWRSGASTTSSIRAPEIASAGTCIHPTASQLEGQRVRLVSAGVPEDLRLRGQHHRTRSGTRWSGPAWSWKMATRRTSPGPWPTSTRTIRYRAFQSRQQGHRGAVRRRRFRRRFRHRRSRRQRRRGRRGGAGGVAGTGGSAGSGGGGRGGSAGRRGRAAAAAGVAAARAAREAAPAAAGAQPAGGRWRRRRPAGPLAAARPAALQRPVVWAALLRRVAVAAAAARPPAVVVEAAARLPAVRRAQGVGGSTGGSSSGGSGGNTGSGGSTSIPGEDGVPAAAARWAPRRATARFARSAAGRAGHADSQAAEPPKPPSALNDAFRQSSAGSEPGTRSTHVARNPGARPRASIITMRPLVVHSGQSAVAAVVMSAGVASCVAGVHGTAPPDASVSTTPDSAADVRSEVMPPNLSSPFERWLACDPATGLNCPVPPCGNGMLNPPAETCDDGNRTGGDGCSPDCKTETDWICPTPGSPCLYTVVCGDGLVAGAETCDDHNTEAGRRLQRDAASSSRGGRVRSEGARCVPSLRRRHEAGLRAVRRRQRLGRATAAATRVGWSRASPARRRARPATGRRAATT